MLMDQLDEFPKLFGGGWITAAAGVGQRRTKTNWACLKQIEHVFIAKLKKNVNCNCKFIPPIYKKYVIIMSFNDLILDDYVILSNTLINCYINKIMYMFFKRDLITY